MTRRLLCALAALLALLSTAAMPIAAEAQADTLTVVLTGGYRGRVTGCDCPGGSRGGLAPRAALQRRLFQNETVVGLDAGRFLDLDPEGGAQRSFCTLKGLADLGLKAALATPRDLFYGLDFLSRAADSAKVSLIAANIISAESQAPLFKPWTLVEEGGRRVVIVGIVQHELGRRFPGAGGWSTSLPDTVLKLLNDLPRADLSVLLTDFSEAEIREAENLLAHFHLVVTSSRQVYSASPAGIAGSLVLFPAPDGGALEGVRVVFSDAQPPKFLPFREVITAHIPAEPTVQKWLDDCLNSSRP